MSLFDKLKGLAPEKVVSASVAEWHKTAHPTHGRHRPAVDDSTELTRVLKIPRREPVDLEGSVKAEALVQLMTERLRRENPACKCAEMGRPCITRLKPAQAWALYEAPLAGGILGPIGVGHGKTVLNILTPLVMPRCKVAVLLIPPGLREQLLREYYALKEHFQVPSLVLGDRGRIEPGKPVLHVIPFSLFSRARSTDLLTNLKPDLVIVDEAHKLRHKQTATTARILRYFAQNPETRLCCWSGTLTAKSVKDYGHLSAIALRENSPLPLDPNVLEEWALALDPSDWPAPAGALQKLCEPGEDLHRGYHRRLTQTLGVVSTKAGAVDASINFLERKAPTIPEHLNNLLQNLRAGWIRPDGEELIDAMRVAENARHLACGFYYRWKFPRGEPEELINAWFAARKAWHRELRDKLKDRREFLDSDLLCRQAAIRAYSDYKGPLPVWKAVSWPDWCKIKDEVQPESEAVWVDEYLARDAAQWAKKHRGIVWYEASAFGRRVAEIAGLPLYEGGPKAAERLQKETGKRSIVMSIKAHGTGTDGLQRIFNEQLVANPPSSGATWEQLLGRLHRIGQEADEVTTYVYRHTPEMREAIDKALMQARYIENTMGTLQKLLSASFDWSL